MSWPCPMGPVWEARPGPGVRAGLSQLPAPSSHGAVILGGESEKASLTGFLKRLQWFQVSWFPRPVVPRSRSSLKLLRPAPSPLGPVWSWPAGALAGRWGPGQGKGGGVCAAHLLPVVCPTPTPVGDPRPRPPPPSSRLW